MDKRVFLRGLAAGTAVAAGMARAAQAGPLRVGVRGGMTVSVIAMVNASAMAGAVGAGGLGDLAIRYGYERYETHVMFEVIVILVALVSVLQWVGERLARHVDHRR